MFQYKVVRNVKQENTEFICNEYARQGWRFTQATFTGASSDLYFEKQASN